MLTVDAATSAKPLAGSRLVPIPPSQAAQLFVVVDTEEEFDWSAPFSSAAVDVSAISEIWRLQRVLTPHGIVPTYVIDFPVANSPAAGAHFTPFLERGECAIGAHLHPWVNPPHREGADRAMSYACNLGIDLEREKIARLRHTIFERLGVDARIYKAGRYGFGPTTAAVLEDLGFDVDVSVIPHMTFVSDGGPSFEGLEPVPFVFGRGRRLLELPCTTGFTGLARRWGPTLHPAASSKWLRPVRAVGLLSHAKLLNKVMLSPEGNTFDEMCALTECLHASGVRTFSLTLHSPSLKPGCTPYVRTTRDRDALLDTIDRYCEYFIGTLRGTASTPDRLYQEVCCEGRV